MKKTKAFFLLGYFCFFTAPISFFTERSLAGGKGEIELCDADLDPYLESHSSSSLMEKLSEKNDPAENVPTSQAQETVVWEGNPLFSCPGKTARLTWAPLKYGPIG
ncbi:hypothetical protein [Candidatus Methylacidiphilum infernorum]|uniref:hypothetical protein n=1 Tax=Candidatus Methylacidiphilum infernorum TaxID=511746 RepID=UPI001F5C99AF|nr:hypothetical protein [Candidatus Methylacidiphilum infernorum]